MGKNSIILNVIKGVKSLLKGKSMAPISTFFDPRYPPTKFFQRNQIKLEIRCIMCGFPRSGTHWIKNVIEKSTNYKTGDLFENKPEPLDKLVLVMKIHARNKSIAYLKAKWLLPPFEFGGKYIYVYRDPRDSIISLFEMYEKNSIQKKMTIMEFFKIYDPIAQYRWEINHWVSPKHKNLLLVKFEDLKLFPKEGFQRIFSYIGMNGVSFEQHINQMVAMVDHNQRPRGIAYGWKSAPKKYEQIIKKVSKDLKNEIIMLGYDES